MDAPTTILPAMKWYHYLLNIDILGFIIIFGLVIYFANSRGKYKQHFNHILESISDDNIDSDRFSVERSRELRRKGVVGDNTKDDEDFDEGPKESRPEKKCRKIFESIFNRKFRKIRPDFLKNPVTGQNLELDGFSSKIRTRLGKGLAYEYDGEQHSNYTPGMHSKSDDFVYQVKKDSFKDTMCRKKGILLIRIPAWVPYSDLESYIRTQLRKERLIRSGIYD